MIEFKQQGNKCKIHREALSLLNAEIKTLGAKLTQAFADRNAASKKRESATNELNRLKALEIASMAAGIAPKLGATASSLAFGLTGQMWRIEEDLRNAKGDYISATNIIEQTKANLERANDELKANAARFRELGCD
ncbi:hypothetical protein FJU08_19055 [Martelella alba]|uniref:Uncharacterized protein n=1 Tax=Martelella alba TaxID=2590451 RepID=A0A506U5I8_9HYPH|nr:hypothetical protein [Martelella alba]TPW27829.1 hypothetical protein FJU08_19055 [Martelella alba]